MRLEHYPEEKLKKEILDIAGKYVDLKKSLKSISKWYIKIKKYEQA